MRCYFNNLDNSLDNQPKMLDFIGFKTIFHIDNMKIKTKDMIHVLIKMEIIKVKSDTIYELFP